MSKNNQPIILYVLIGILIVAIAIGPIYNAFNDDTHEHAFDYNDVSEYGHDGMEVLYRYHPDCGICRSIEPDVNEFQEGNNEDVPLHKIHVEHEDNLPQGLNTAVPSVLVVIDGEIVDEIVNGEQVTSFFDEVNDGSYSAD